MRNFITGPVTYSVTLGQAGYGDRLTVTASGSIVPAYQGYDGLVVPNTLQDARVLNQGLIAGSRGYDYPTGDGGHGGTGVLLGSGRLDNAGTLRGGQGGDGYGYGGTGGAGVDLGAGAVLVNTGAIAAGTGGAPPGGPRHEATEYVDEETVRAERVWARRICARRGWPVVDVTRRSIEETAATVLQLMDSWHARQRRPPSA